MYDRYVSKLVEHKPLLGALSIGVTSKLEQSPINLLFRKRSIQGYNQLSMMSNLKGHLCKNFSHPFTPLVFRIFKFRPESARPLEYVPSPALRNL